MMVVVLMVKLLVTPRNSGGDGVKLVLQNIVFLCSCRGVVRDGGGGGGGEEEEENEKDL